MLKKILLATSALAAASSMSLAADLPVRAPAPAPVMIAPIFTWTGFYVGVNAGWVGTDTKTNDPYSSYFDDCWWGCNYSFSSNGNGFIGGIQAGYNYQMGAFVMGIEGDMNWTSASSQVRGGYFSDYYHKSSLTALGTLRARLGFAIDRTLIYATGGFAFGRVKNSFTDLDDTYFNGQDSSWQTGWTLGGGVEYAFTNNWTAKIEALYFDLGNANVRDAYYGADAYAKRFDTTGWTVRAGVNYKFGSPAAPVVARY